MSQRKRYTKQFKEEALRLVSQEGFYPTPATKGITEGRKLGSCGSKGERSLFVINNGSGARIHSLRTCPPNRGKTSLNYFPSF